MNLLYDDIAEKIEAYRNKRSGIKGYIDKLKFKSYRNKTLKYLNTLHDTSTIIDYWDIEEFMDFESKVRGVKIVYDFILVDNDDLKATVHTEQDYKLHITVEAKDKFPQEYTVKYLSLDKDSIYGNMLLSKIIERIDHYLSL